MRFVISAAFVIGIIAFLIAGGCTGLVIHAGNFSNASPKEDTTINLWPPLDDNTNKHSATPGNSENTESNNENTISTGCGVDEPRMCHFTIHDSKSESRINGGETGAAKSEVTTTAHFDIDDTQGCRWTFLGAPAEEYPGMLDPSYDAAPLTGTGMYQKTSTLNDENNELLETTTSSVVYSGPFSYGFGPGDLNDLSAAGDVIETTVTTEVSWSREDNHLKKSTSVKQFEMKEPASPYFGIGVTSFPSPNWKCIKTFEKDCAKYSLQCSYTEQKKEPGYSHSLQENFDLLVTSSHIRSDSKTKPITTQTTVELPPLVPQDKPITTETTVDLAPLVPTTVTLAPLVPHQ